MHGRNAEDIDIEGYVEYLREHLPGSGQYVAVMRSRKADALTMFFDGAPEEDIARHLGMSSLDVHAFLMGARASLYRVLPGFVTESFTMNNAPVGEGVERVVQRRSHAESYWDQEFETSSERRRYVAGVLCDVWPDIKFAVQHFMFVDRQLRTGDMPGESDVRLRLRKCLSDHVKSRSDLPKERQLIVGDGFDPLLSLLGYKKVVTQHGNRVLVNTPPLSVAELRSLARRRRQNPDEMDKRIADGIITIVTSPPAVREKNIRPR